MNLGPAQLPAASQYESVAAACLNHIEAHCGRRFARKVRKQEEIFATLLHAAAQAADDVTEDGDMWMASADAGPYQATSKELRALQDAYARVPVAVGESTVETVGAERDARDAIYAALVALLTAAVPYLGLSLLARLVAPFAIRMVAKAISGWLADLMTAARMDSNARDALANVAAYGRAAGGVA